MFSFIPRLHCTTNNSAHLIQAKILLSRNFCLSYPDLHSLILGRNLISVPTVTLYPICILY